MLRDQVRALSVHGKDVLLVFATNFLELLRFDGVRAQGLAGLGLEWVCGGCCSGRRGSAPLIKGSQQ